MMGTSEEDPEFRLELLRKLYRDIRRRYLLTIQMIPSTMWNIPHPSDVLKYETILDTVDNNAFIARWHNALEEILSREVDAAEFTEESDDFEEMVQKVRRICQSIREYQRQITVLRLELEKKRHGDFKWAFALGIHTWAQQGTNNITDETWQRLLQILGKPYFRGDKPMIPFRIEEIVNYINERCHTFQQHENGSFLATFDQTDTTLTHVHVLGEIRSSRDFIIQAVEPGQVANTWGLPRGWHMSNFIEVGFPFVDTTRSLTGVLKEADTLELEFNMVLDSHHGVPDMVWKSSVNNLWVPLKTERTVTALGKGKIGVKLKTRTKALSAFGFGGNGNSGAFGDPYINPLWGRVYKMPVDEYCYRFLDVGTGSERLQVNIQFWVVPDALQRQTTNWGYETQGGMRNQIFFQNNQKVLSSFANSVGRQSFIRKVAVFVGERCILIYDLEEHIAHTSHLRMTEPFLFYGTNGALPVYQRDPAISVVASLDTSILGCTRIFLNKFYNPQLRTGISIVSDRSIPENASGLMCRHYVPETMRVNGLNDLNDLDPIVNTSKGSIIERFIENGTIFNVNIRV